MSKLTLGRAVTAYIARRVVKLATIIALSVFGAIVIICAVLAHFFSVWWWLLIIPAALLFGIFIAIRLLVVLIIGRIHTEQLSNEQRAALAQFTDKVQTVVEARTTPLSIMIVICLKDLVIHGDIVTVKQLIRDTAALLSDYQKLERLF